MSSFDSLAVAANGCSSATHSAPVREARREIDATASLVERVDRTGVVKYILCI